MFFDTSKIPADMKARSATFVRSGLCHAAQCMLPILVAVSLLLVAGGRLIVVAWRSEIGFGYVSGLLRQAAWGWTGWQHLPVGNLEASAQADFWLHETDRILGSSPPLPELAMGAALVLDSPGNGYLYRHLRQQTVGQTTLSLGPMLDEHAVERAEGEFETQCRDKCLALARRATEIAPDEVHWWRLRALLQCTGKDLSMRHESSFDVWKECLRHDPDNALYDYLIAVAYLNKGAKRDFDPNSMEMIWIISDPSEIQNAVEHFEQGQKKSYLALGEAGISSILELLAHSKVPKVEQVDICRSRLLSIRESGLLIELFRWQQSRTATASDLNLQASSSRQTVHLVAQLAASPEAATRVEHLIMVEMLSRSAFQRLEEIAVAHPDAVSADEKTELVSTQSQLKADGNAVRNIVAQIDQNHRKAMQSSPSVLAFSALDSCVGILILLAAALFCVGWILKTTESAETPALGAVRHLAAWAAGCGATFVWLGLVPAGVISQQLAVRLAIGAVTVLCLGLAAAVLRRDYWKLRRRRFRFSLLSLIVFTAVMAAIYAAAPYWPLVGGRIPSISNFSMLSEILPKPDEQQVLAWRAAMDPPLGSLTLAIVYWLSADGPLLSIALSILIAALWFCLLCARSASTGVIHDWTHGLRARISALLRCLAKSCAGIGLLAVIVWLWLAPSIVRQAGTFYHNRTEYFRDPDRYYENLDGRSLRPVCRTPRALETARAATSALSQLEFRVGEFEFSPGIFDFPLQVDAALSGVGVARPADQFGLLIVKRFSNAARTPILLYYILY